MERKVQKELINRIKTWARKETPIKILSCGSKTWVLKKKNESKIHAAQKGC
jgi:hypothetical protein